MWSPNCLLFLGILSLSLATLGQAALRRDEVPLARRNTGPPLFLRQLPTIADSVAQGQEANVTPAGNPTPNSYGLTPLTLSDDGSSYYVVLQTGQITFRVALDTGSSDLWLVSSACTDSQCSSLPRYPLGYESSTFSPYNDNNTQYSTHFADGTGASGFVAYESVQVANVTVPKQAFGLVSQSNLTLDDQMSGVMGMGFPRLSQISNAVADGTGVPWFSSLAEQGIVDYPVFGLSLTRNATGTLAVGAIDSSVVTNTSDIVWNEVVPFSPYQNQFNTSGYVYWAIHMTEVAVNGSGITPVPTYPGPTENSSIALLDVGNSGIYGPWQDVEQIMSKFPSSRLVDESGQWAVPCDSSAIMSFSFGSEDQFILQPSDYLIGPVSTNPTMCLTWPMASSPDSTGIDWKLGTPFLRTVYSIFSLGIDTKEPPMIGLYPRTNASTTTVEPYPALQSFFSSASATIAATLPNSLLATPTPTAPPYLFNTSVPAVLGQIPSAGLATRTYSPVVGTELVNATALRMVPEEYTLVVTNSAGDVVTSTYAVSQPTGPLGRPPGWSGAAGRARAVDVGVVVSCAVSVLAVVVAGAAVL
ncbi:acid protease [Coniophora puteana RWD-64-598 SS2]|uniref:Acid protease n=1 Tax=Coniophora puteana (strain RWD-64-598) TaxID=741705 RepID=A0A5M3MXW7_CONPW|nr:acid protease [Coniophora puteana RWD-64-598 SS2]EIW83876.1 acid protease [Coniophora puteana RWD-64-598 SS2]